MAKWATIGAAALLVLLLASRAKAEPAPGGFAGDWTYLDGTQPGAGWVM